MINVSSKIFDYYADGKLYIDSECLCSKEITEAEFEVLFPASDYNSKEFAYGEGSVKYEQVDFIFKDVYELIKKVTECEYKNINNFPKEIISIDSGVHKLNNFPENYKDWMSLLLKLANHSYKSPHQIFVFIEKNSSGTSTVLDVKINDFEKSKILYLIDNISSPKSLLDSCSDQDVHQGERLSTMKTSLTELINKKGFNLIELLCSSEVLLETYHKIYETYLRSFSFDEFIKDLEDDVGSFIDKVEEQIQGFYVQALAVPGAVILASAFRGVEKGISISLLFSTFLAITIVFASLKSKIKFIERIKKNTLSKLKIYHKRTDGIGNQAAKDSILEKINEAISSVNKTSKDNKRDIYKMRDTIIALGIMYIIAATVFGVS